MIEHLRKLYRLVRFLTVVRRSPHWPGVRAKHLYTEGWCRGCSGVSHLEVHHIVPFHIDKSKELDDSNLITLCEFPGVNCHLDLGHRGDWKDFDPDIRKKAIAPKP